MVDDPSTYVDVLRSDAKLRRKAERALKARMKVWEEAQALAKKAAGTGVAVPQPGPEPTLDELLAEQERERLFSTIESLVLWENTANETVLQAARDEIWQSWRRACADNAGNPGAKELFDRNRLPAFHDPFAGGGALPVEAQRLGLESYASDLNPVAVLINKAMIEIPPQVAGNPPVNPEANADGKLLSDDWRGAEGLAEDIRYYGKWLRREAEKRIGHLYPTVRVTPELAEDRADLEKYVGQDLRVVAWLWARTVKSPNPAFSHVDVPLAATFLLSKKKGSEAYIEPLFEGEEYRFVVKQGTAPDPEKARRGTKLSRGNFECLLSGSPISSEYLRGEGQAGRMGLRMLAVVAEGEREKVYLPPTEESETVARSCTPEWEPDIEFFEQGLGFRIGNYGLKRWSDLFTSRQTQALDTFSGLVEQLRERVRQDTQAALKGQKDARPAAYADAIAIYLACAISRACDYWNTNATWEPGGGFVAHAFTRQAIPMVWDFAEANPFSNASGNWESTCVEWVERVARGLNATTAGTSVQADAQRQSLSSGKVISTDPPYYDNVGYADLSDFFYVWLRRSLAPVAPELFSTVAVPKAEELVATPARHGGKKEANEFFLKGMTQAMQRLAEQTHPAVPVTIYYAFKQAEGDGARGVASTGWETFLGSVIGAGFEIHGTWPLRTERAARTRGIGSNALASSILLVCRPRPGVATTATRREFMKSLRSELPLAVGHLQGGSIAPVDLAQSAIGPGMAVYSRYARVVDAEGKPVSVREALALINQTLDEVLAEQEGDFDADSRWALTWFEEQGFDEGDFGVAEQLSKSKNTSVGGMVEAGILESKRGKVRLLRPDELPSDWDPVSDPRLTTWEVVHHLVRILASGGESGAAELVAKLGAKAEVARELAYRLYTLCERQNRAPEALAYNGLVQSWPEIMRLSRERATPAAAQSELFEQE